MAYTTLKSRAEPHRASCLRRARRGASLNVARDTIVRSTHDTAPIGGHVGGDPGSRIGLAASPDVFCDLLYVWVVFGRARAPHGLRYDTKTTQVPAWSFAFAGAGPCRMGMRSPDSLLTARMKAREGGAKVEEPGR